MKKITLILPILLGYLLSTVPCHAYRDLETGVFLSRDPAGQVDGPNVYTYVRQNPWSAFDPEGLDMFGINTNLEKGTDTFTVFGGSFTVGGLGTNYNAGWLNGKSRPSPNNTNTAPMTLREFAMDEAKQIPRDIKNMVKNPGENAKQLAGDLLQYPGNPTSMGNAVLAKGAQNAPQLLTEGKIALDYGKSALGNISARCIRQVALDTNAIIARLEGGIELQKMVSIAMAGRNPRVSITSIKEFLKGGGDVIALRSFLSANGGGVARAAKSEVVTELMGKGLKSADSNVLGSAIREGTELLTRDKKILKKASDTAKPF